MGFSKATHIPIRESVAIMQNKQSSVKVGIGILILKDNKVLLGRRKGAHGAGEYAFPGGHLEYKESFAACARRETWEECGLEITNIRFQHLANTLAYAPVQYVHIGLTADWKAGRPVVREPHKREGWDWFALDALPKPLFAMCTLAFTSYRTGQTYYDLY